MEPAYLVDFLNTILLLDPTALQSLIETRVPCNEALASHPTVQVLVEGDGCRVGLLGILNGLCGVREDGWGFITADFDDAGVLTRFRLTP